MCKTCIALAAPAAKTSLPTCSPCDDTRASLSSAKNATTSLNAVELPCTVDLISLVEVLGTPRENVAVVTVLDNADPNSGSKWRKKQVLVRRRQMMRQSSAAAVRDDAAQPA